MRDATAPQAPRAAAAPVMFLRVDARRAHGRALVQLLRERAIEPREVELQRARAVIRAEVPLARLPGVQRMIGELTDGSAHTMSWLLRDTRGGSVTDAGARA